VWLLTLVYITSELALGYDDFASVIQNFELLPLNDKLSDAKGEDLERAENFLGTIPDTDWTQIEDKVYNYNMNNKVEKSTGIFRQEPGASRGSEKHRAINVKPWPHKPKNGAPPGCGNPVCVIIDKKPRRFQSVCDMAKFMKTNSRCEQINFAQKGDCYQIIDTKEKADALPWSSDAKTADCGACRNDEYCNQKVVFIIDINSVLKGQSSAPGGGTFRASSDGHGNRMAGLPFDFENICEAMKTFESMPNINVKTQLVGVAFMEMKNLFTINADDAKCVWTEWFDHDTPCNSEYDLEEHCQHLAYLRSTKTGSYRIGQAKDIVETQHEGGSEITQVTASEAKQGNAYGSDRKTKFIQIIKYSKTGIQCRNQDQQITQLPPPYIYNDDRNNSCLDYKSRYCIKTTTMWRPQPLSSLDARFPPTLPIGVSITILTRDKGTGALQTAVIRVHTKDNDRQAMKTIKIMFPKSQPGYTTQQPNNGGKDSGAVTITIQCHGVTRSIKGTYKLIRSPNGVEQYSIDVPHGKSGTSLGTITFFTHHVKFVQFAMSTKIVEHQLKLISVTRVQQPGKKASGKHQPGSKVEKLEGYSPQGPEDTGKQFMNNNLPIYAEVTDFEGGKKTYIAILQATSQPQCELLHIPIINGSLTTKNVEPSPTSLYQRIQEIISTHSIDIIVDSPPLANLFHECDWKDWLSNDYPDKLKGLNAEYELRFMSVLQDKFKEHVCGSVPEHAHYVDAVTVEDQIPWHELKMGQEQYETFKLTPYFGYACKDLNGPKVPKYCKDMKVRYCCERQDRASWGRWGAWSQCDKTCGGGTKIRKRNCISDKAKESNPKYNRLCYGQEPYIPAEIKDRLCREKADCNVGGCPEDYAFSPWSAWSRCSISCGEGFKTSTRFCNPAKNNGKECPLRSVPGNMDLYEKKQTCTAGDCERFRPNLWTSWGACSVTCGVGEKRRTRGCMSELTHAVVSDSKCVMDASAQSSFFMQSTPCKLANCPVDGAWSVWGAWSQCSQNCVDHPESTSYGQKKVITKAFRRRERFCANPRVAFGGKDCQKDTKFIYNSKLQSEEHRTDCITELTRSDKDHIVTPWCPEHCIFTMWGEWSPCSFTCIELKFTSNYDKNRVGKDLSLIEYHKTTHTLPTRTRIRLMVRPARFKGSCPEQEASFDQPGTNNGTMLRQQEDCVLCPEHCLNEINPLKYTKLIQLKPITKPTPNCVGYCAVDCVTQDYKGKQCMDEIEKYIERKPGYREDMHEDYPDVNIIEGACFAPEVLVALVQANMMNEYENYRKLFAKYIASTNLKDFMENFPPEEPPRPEGEHRRVYKEWEDDFDRLKSFKLKFMKISPQPINADGLVGGKHCTAVNLTFTSNPELKGPQYTNKGAVDVEEIDPNCHIPLCEINRVGPNKLDARPCQYFRWTAWGPWGKCDETCGEKGVRTRTRTCENSCKAEKVEDDKCTPLVDQGTIRKGKTWTSSYTGPCTPCPPEYEGTWSEWTNWSTDKVPECAKTKGMTMDVTRSRKCNPGKHIKTCRPSFKGKNQGLDIDTVKRPLPLCGY